MDPCPTRTKRILLSRGAAAAALFVCLFALWLPAVDSLELSRGARSQWRVSLALSRGEEDL